MIIPIGELKNQVLSNTRATMPWPVVAKQLTTLLPVVLVLVLVFVLFEIARRCLWSRQLGRLVLFRVLVIFLQCNPNPSWSVPETHRAGHNVHQPQANEHINRFAPPNPPP